MRTLNRIIPLLLSFVFMLAVGIALGAAAPAAKTSTTKTTTKTSAAINKSTAKPTAKVEANKKKTDVLASAENLSGTISSVDPSDKEVTLIGSNGVPYDFDLTKGTHIEASNKKIGANELAGESHKQATIHFLPTSHGNMAESIQISAS